MSHIFEFLDLAYTEVVEDICIHIIDNEGKTVYYSKGCEKIEGYKKEDIVGEYIGDTYWSVDNKNFNEITSMHLNVLKNKVAVKNVPMTYYAANNKLLQVVSSTYPIFKEGVFVGAMCLFKDVTELLNIQSKLGEMKKLIRRESTSKLENGTYYKFSSIIGKSRKLMETIEQAKKLAVGSSPIMIVGETGSGKELFAQSIHNFSDHSEGPFVPVNCSAIPDTLIESILFGTTKGSFTGASEKIGLFEEAQNGTIFLDEINSMDLMVQSKLLRILEERKVRRVGGRAEISLNCRVISASNMDTKHLMDKVLRNDLFYRLAASSIEIPPLRNRPEDISILINHFIQENNYIMKRNVHNIDDICLNVLERFSWPGNVRQLKHAIDYSFNLMPFNEVILTSEYLPHYIFSDTKTNVLEKMEYNSDKKDLVLYLNDMERNLIIKTIKSFNGNLSQSAKSLGISRQRLHYRIKILNIETV